MSPSQPTAASAPPLPGYTARELGPERASLAVALRERLWAAGLRWPHWIDARPGLLGALVGDCADPPLGQSRAALLQQHSPMLVEGLGALGLALAAPRLALALPALSALAPALRGQLAATQIELWQTPASFPAQPAHAQAAESLAGAPWVVPAETLAAAGAVLRGLPAPRLISVVGVVRRPQALAWSGPASPRELVERAGGTEDENAAWVALRNDPLSGELWPADEPLPPDTTLVYILPTGHPLVRRQRVSPPPRLRLTCLSCRLCTELCPESARGTEPHRILHALARRELVPDDVLAARGCTGCGACSLACPAELLPGAIVSALAEALPDTRATAAEPPPLPEKSRLPLELALRRLGLAEYARP